jgi:hypothetical protein
MFWFAGTGVNEENTKNMKDKHQLYDTLSLTKLRISVKEFLTTIF